MQSSVPNQPYPRSDGSKNRFADESFLRRLGLDTIVNFLGNVLTVLFHILVRYAIFGGVLGSFWVMAIIDPQGSILWYVTPAVALAVPIALLSDRQTVWEKIFSAILLLSLWGAIALLLWQRWKTIEYTGQIILPILLGIVVAGFFSALIFRKKNREGTSQQRSGVIQGIWFVGVVIIPILFAAIFYYGLWHHQRIESSASILFSAFAFVFCLTLTIMRIYWMDGIRNARAMRIGEYPSEDAVNLLELLIPRSMFLVVMVPCLLFSEAVMFSVIHRTTYISAARHKPQEHALRSVPPSTKTVAPSPAQKRTLSPEKPELRSKDSLPKHRNTPRPSSRSSENTTNVQGSRISVDLQISGDPGYRIWAWFDFVTRPYVFPKNPDGTEIDAPVWMKWFGRILWGFILFLFITHQLNIWAQFKNSYLTLFNLSRDGAKTHDSAGHLNQQWEQVELNIRSMLDHYGGMWRRIIFFAVTSPASWLLWKWILDTGRAFLETVDKIYRYCQAKWDVAVFGGWFFLSLITLPFALYYNIYLPFFLCILPSFIVGCTLVISSKWYDAPLMRGWLLPWLFPAHLVFSFIYFFVALSVRNAYHFSLQMLLIVNIILIIVYPILYFFVNERQSSSESTEESIPCHHIQQARMSFLKQFFYLEHRQWALDALIYRIYPGRSRVMSVVYVLPSLQLGFFQFLRSLSIRLQKFIQGRIESLSNALKTDIAFSAVVSFLFFLFASFRTVDSVGLLLEKVALTALFGIGLTVILWMIHSLYCRWKGHSVDSLSIPAWKVNLLLLSWTLVWIFALLFFIQTKLWGAWFLRISLGCLVFFPRATAYYWYSLSKNRNESSDENHHHTSDHSKTANPPSTGNEQKSEDATKSAEESKPPQSQPKQTAQYKVLNNWIENLRRRESTALAGIYGRVHWWGRTEPEMRDAMCEGLYFLLEATQEKLRTERWFREDVRELERVRHTWLGGGSVADSKDLTKPALELASLFSQILDVLGSIIYDQAHIDRREMLKLYLPPSISLLFDTLERILRLARPVDGEEEMNNEQFKELDDILQDFGFLLEKLIKNHIRSSSDSNHHIRSASDSNIDKDWCQKQLSHMSRIFRLLQPDKFDKLWQTDLDSSTDSLKLREDVAPSREDVVTSQDRVMSWLSASWERSEQLMQLPTPLAHRYDNMYRVYQELENKKKRTTEQSHKKNYQDHVYLRPMQLHTHHTHQRWHDFHQEKKWEQSLIPIYSRWWETQRHLYQELLAYLLSCIKTYLPFDPEKYSDLLNLHWQTPEEQYASYECLRTSKHLLPAEAVAWADLYLHAYKKPLIDQLARQQIDAFSQEIVFQEIENLLENFLKDSAIPDNNHPSVLARGMWYTQTIKIPFTVPAKEQDVEISFSGLHPHLRLLKGEMTIQRSSPCFQAKALLWTGDQTYDTRRLDIWNAKWLLELMLQACLSRDMWSFPFHSHCLRYLGFDSKKNKWEKIYQALCVLFPIVGEEQTKIIDRVTAQIEQLWSLLSSEDGELRKKAEADLAMVEKKLMEPHRNEENELAILLYRQLNLEHFTTVLHQLGSLLSMPAQEEQSIVDTLFHKIEDRLDLLKRNLTRPANDTPLDSGYSFDTPLRTVENKLKDMQWLGEMRMAQLVYAGLLPQSTFLYLSDVIFSPNGTFLCYQSGDGKEIKTKHFSS